MKCKNKSILVPEESYEGVERTVILKTYTSFNLRMT